ncbi:family 78 glycoside hydrolase catalytic domain [Kibdelosporangium aridum]|uniref:alpha-L-rhamnosidase n=1 Tax=Kibdelosporangium aridum TaxID=2030 RepID=A0A1W2E6T8_KIBAR|nr:family 78 glycoside hydrolase catalytic domain [Kibdelosporangium aridum]SMD05474.1 alpha-L-rhamnosidase [Kibdelosporangium aridum]
MKRVNRRVVLGGVAALTAASAIPAWGDENRGGVRPIRLTTEHVTDPLGIDNPNPRFGWQLSGHGTGRKQTAYRIIVAGVWDSGKVMSSGQSTVYSGGPLRSRTRYHWTIQVWDENDQPGPVSGPAWFETAFLEPEEWQAEWIGSGIFVPPPVKTLPQALYSAVDLEPGHTLGQSFESESQMLAVTVLLAVTETASCRMTLRRGDTVIGTKVLSGLVGDRYGEAQGRLDFDKPVEPGSYYLELSDSSGSIGWKGLQANAYPKGVAFADGTEVPGEDRWVYSIPPNPPANPLLRQEFDVQAKIVSARLYVSGFGQALVWVNGRRIAGTPVGTDYDKRILYTTHDVTSLVRQGKNAIGLAMGRGMFATRGLDTDASNLARWIAEPQAKVQVEINGRIVVSSGPSWQLTEGPTVYDAVLAGETYDARRALEGWALPGFDATGWRPARVVPSPGGRMTAYTAEPVVDMDPVRPVKVSVPAPGIRLYDFGAMLAGHVRIRARLPRGVAVKLVHSEKLDARGHVNVGIPGGNENTSVDGRYMQDEYISDGSGEFTWEPSFTYKTFRYVELSGTAIEVDVVAVPEASAVSSTMDIKLDHPELQWIADAGKRTTRNILRGHPDVGRYGWTSATYRAVQPMLYQYGMAALFENWLEDIRVSQGADGEIPLITPSGALSGGRLLTPSSTGVYPYLVHRHWLTYGDKTVLSKHFEGVRKYVTWLLGKLRDGIADDTFGDWYPPKGTPMAPEGGTLVGTAYVIETLRSAIAIASELGRMEQARTWQARADEISRQFNAAFLRSGEYRTAIQSSYRQTGNAVALAFGLVPPAVRAQVVQGLVDDVERKGRHLDTGALGTGALPFALSDNGRPDLAYAVLTQDTYPSFGYLRSLGATTFWESWEKESRGHQDPTLSLVVNWLVERAVGVSLLEPGWARFRVVPGRVGSRVVLDTVRGRISVSWRAGAGEIEVPVNSEAEVILPSGAKQVLGSGRHLVRMDERR